MIRSVSTWVMLMGTATPVSLVNLSIAALSEIDPRLQPKSRNAGQRSRADQRMRAMSASAIVRRLAIGGPLRHIPRIGRALAHCKDGCVEVSDRRAASIATTAA
jgi:hypothetical protein